MTATMDSNIEQNTIAGSERSTAGTFSFCESCPKETNCCTRISHFGTIEPPFLFPQEREKVASQWPSNSLRHYRTFEGRIIWTLASKEPGCIFNVAGKCAIYDSRPFDCRLFPFDIRATNSKGLAWVVYTKLCPVEFDYMRYFPAAKILLKRLAPSKTLLADYAFHGSRNMYKQEALELEPVQLDF
jgi:Fe-S-cluster containining protein